MAPKLTPLDLGIQEAQGRAPDPVSIGLVEEADIRLYQRLMSKTEVYDPAYRKHPGCWIWTGATNPRGVALVKAHGKVQSVHRVAWELLRGDIPEGKVLYRTCGDLACWYPEHVVAMEHWEIRRKTFNDNSIWGPLE